MSARRKPKAPTTPTGRPRMGGELEVLATDGETWIPCRIRGVGDGRDAYGQAVISVLLEFLDEEGGVSEFLRWDTVTWRSCGAQP